MPFLLACPKPARNAASYWFHNHDRDKVSASTTETAEATETAVPATAATRRRIRSHLSFFVIKFMT